MSSSRLAGILLHITSLPGRFGIGDLGPAAHRFVDFLNESGQSVWQILPLCPTSVGNSPYSSYSAFAGNMLLISPESLVKDGWLTSESLRSIESKFANALSQNPANVDFESAREVKNELLMSSFRQSKEELFRSEAFLSFRDTQSWWLDEFSLFEALREHFGETTWTTWPEECQSPNSVSASMLLKIADEIDYSVFKQFVFHQQWSRLKEYANSLQIQFCGDMPIFVAFDSADVWANKRMFLLDESGNPTSVAGVPPDYFSETGQLWGNPLYDWPEMEAAEYSWWVQRFRRSLEQFDLLRVDHFRGFDRYWKVPADAETAAEGVWESGPREKPFLAAENELGSLPIWAEDLGDIDEGVHQLRDQLGFPTMRVMQFGYDTEADDFHRHTTYFEECIAYTGTHDNDTLMGWYYSRNANLDSNQKDVLASYLNSDDAVHLQLIKLLYQSPAKVSIVPLQDLVGLGNEARMNVPGVAEGNWQWRFDDHLLTKKLAEQIKDLVSNSGRIGTGSTLDV